METSTLNALIGAFAGVFGPILLFFIGLCLKRRCDDERSASQRTTRYRGTIVDYGSGKSEGHTSNRPLDVNQVSDITKDCGKENAIQIRHIKSFIFFCPAEEDKLAFDITMQFVNTSIEKQNIQNLRAIISGGPKHINIPCKWKYTYQERKSEIIEGDNNNELVKRAYEKPRGFSISGEDCLYAGFQFGSIEALQYWLDKGRYYIEVMAWASKIHSEAEKPIVRAQFEFVIRKFPAIHRLCTFHEDATANA